MKHEGLHKQRLAAAANNPREVAFAAEWQKENPEQDFRSSVLCALMVERSDHPQDGFVQDWDLATGRQVFLRRTPISQNEATIVATIIQWLGSNVGMCFLESALGKCGYRIERKGASNV